jgi:hypothetical protein
MLRALKNSPVTAKGKKEKTFFAADETILRVFSFFSIMARKIFPIYDMGYVLKSHCITYFYQTVSVSILFLFKKSSPSEQNKMFFEVF